MSFFIRNNKNNNNNKKTKKKLVKNRSNAADVNKAKRSGTFSTKKKDKRQLDDEEILSDDLGDDDDDEQEIIDSDLDEPSARKKSKKAGTDDDEDDEDEDDEELETAQEKKIRLAKQYLTELENREKERDLSDEEDGEEDQIHRSNLISAQLKDNILLKSGQLHRKVADKCRQLWSETSILLRNGHRKTITSCVVSFDGKFVFTGSKDCTIIKWNRETGKRIKTIFGNHREDPEKYRGHTATVTALAISSDFKFLASGCMNRMIHVWRPADLTFLHTFRGHRDSITGLAFRRSFHQLFSSSSDRMVKVWNLDEMAYIESLFGHHDTITSIDSFVRERAITSGGRDGTIRLWKIPEESHLIFLTGGDATVDLVRFIDENHFLSACDNGTVSIWGLFKKKPLASVKMSHGPDMWVTAIAPLRNTDLFATGSYNGKICFWKLGNEFRSIEKIFDYDVVGFVNSLEFTSDGKFLIASVGQEHRLGRWWRIKEARNVVHIIPLMIDENIENVS